jgi:chemotaxis protein CheZ
MPVQRKFFRIEEMSGIAAARSAPGNGEISASIGAEIRAELKALHQLVERLAASSPVGGGHETNGSGSTVDALLQIKGDITALHAGAFGCEPSRMSRELAAVADGAGLATQVILDAAENIEDAAKSLAASLKHGQEQALALDIQDHVLRIFEACNFHDLGGQRIAKVLAMVTAVEARVANVLQVVASVEPLGGTARLPDAAASLHGPRLADDRGHLSQDEIDKWFAAG